MTSIAGIRCRDGVVIGADSSATIGDGSGRVRTIEQPTVRKIEIIVERVIIAGTGYVGHGPRFCEDVRRLHNDDKAIQGKSEIEIAKMLSHHGLKEFAGTFVQQLEYAAFVAYPASEAPCWNLHCPPRATSKEDEGYYMGMVDCYLVVAASASRERG